MRFFAWVTVLAGVISVWAQSVPHTLQAGAGKSITLNLPAGLDIAVAASGLKRPRFFAQAPDGRVFVTTMYNLADNTRGAVYILDGFNAQTHRFERVSPYLQHLRNPNNVTFYTDAQKQAWIYVPLTDKLVRYRYNAGDLAPPGAAQVLMRYPDYGLNYKYGGWHLTRTVAVATLHGKTRVYVSAGSSCNYCREREAQRASLMVMDPDGGHPQIVAHGLRNAVGLQFEPGVEGGALLASNMGDDHLGDRLPEDTFFELDTNARAGAIAGVRAGAVSNVNYGWPTCYFAGGKAVLDRTPLPVNPGEGDARAVAERPVGATEAQASAEAQHGNDSVYGKQGSGASAGTNLAAQLRGQAGLPELGPVPEPLTTCAQVPAAYTTFAAHSSPLGFAYFGGDNGVLKDSFVVALHGSGHQRIGTGYRLARFTAGNRTPQDFVTGFLTQQAGKPVAHGRPCGILRVGPDAFLLTDDSLGLVYFVFPKR